MSYSLRMLTPADQLFLWELLYLAIYVPAGETPPSRDAVQQPELARYVQDWGRKGDLGYAAVDADNHELVGAAWLRLWSGREKGYGYLDDAIPELSIAVRSSYRGRGMGTALMKQLLEDAAQRYPAVSLSVHPHNPAVRLYRRLGFEEAGMAGDSLVMKKRLQGEAG
jgi:ribosomal protein S18 acetylase RimI-like enzyme